MTLWANIYERHRKYVKLFGLRSYAEVHVNRCTLMIAVGRVYVRILSEIYLHVQKKLIYDFYVVDIPI